MTSSRNGSNGCAWPLPAPLSADLACRLVAEIGLGPVTDLSPLAGGRNNRAFRVAANGRMLFLKCFFRHPDDPQDRFGAERAFLELAAAAAITEVPRLLAADADAGALLCPFVDGKRPTTGTVGRRHVRAALDLLGALARAGGLPEAARLPAAAEACFSLEQHIAIVDRRMARLDGMAADDDVAGDARSFVKNQLKPCWQALRAEVRDAGRGAPAAARHLKPDQRIISPSDFGFHNAIEGCDGRLTFVDFEYAGWDDPAKLVADFFVQPEVPVSSDFFPAFRDAVCALAADPVAARRRCDLVGPLHRLKWCGILLNEFLPGQNRRRAFARAGGGSDPRPGQLAKARGLLADIEKQMRRER